MTGNGMIDGDDGSNWFSPLHDRTEETSICDRCEIDGDIRWCEETEENLCPDCVKEEEQNIKDTDGRPRVLILTDK